SFNDAGSLLEATSSSESRLRTTASLIGEQLIGDPLALRVVSSEARALEDALARVPRSGHRLQGAADRPNPGPDPSQADGAGRIVRNAAGDLSPSETHATPSPTATRATGGSEIRARTRPAEGSRRGRTLPPACTFHHQAR